MLSFEEYKSLVNVLPYGKRVGRNVYILTDDLKDASPELSKYFSSINESNAEIVKFFLDQFKISFLDYPDFFTEANPSLHKSTTIDLVTGKKRQIDYSKHENPPILHRKETMISPERNVFEQWANLTLELENRGCFSESRKIGFKLFWDSILNEKGLFIENHVVKYKEKEKSSYDDNDIKIERHKTAMSRSDFSKPVQLLLSNNLLRKGSSFLDYGCGLGDDVRALNYNGYNTFSWDPAYNPDGNKTKSEVVNLGFVLNVIEDKAERIDTLLEAFNLTKKVLSVAVVTDITPTAKNIKPYKDGFLTNRGTFQKFFKHDEAQDFIEQVLNYSAITVSQGIFYIFKNEQDAQDFLSTKQKRKINWNRLNLNIYPSKDERDKVKKETLYSQYKTDIESYWEQLLYLGRAPSIDEYPALSELQNNAKMNPRRLQDWFIERYGQEEFKSAFNNRKDDLIVYLGLANFKKKIPFSSLSPRLQKDMKTFFGNYKSGQQEALVELYKIGNPDEIEKRCKLTNQQNKIGSLDEQALFLSPEDVINLDPVLRMYIGVAELLWGTVDEVSEIKIHKRSGKVTFIVKESPDLNPGEYFRIKVDLVRQKVDFFRHTKSL